MSEDLPTRPAGSFGTETGAPGPAELNARTATEIAAIVASGEVSAVEVVEAHIRRLERMNPRLNAVVVRFFEEARREARAADAARSRGEALGPLHGVPFTVKEMFDVAGSPTTAGLTDRATRRAPADAPVVTSLRRAGGILLGKTNVPQLGAAFESDNPLYGETRNPHRETRAPGGSSGGEAAVIAACGSPLGLGSDGGGSIRQPAHACGISGLKPTSFRLPMAGHFYLPNWLPHWIQPGPMARRVDDLVLAMRVLVGSSGRRAPDPATPPVPFAEPSRNAVAGLRVGFYVDDGFFRAAPALRRAVEDAATALRSAGVEVEEFRPPDVEEALAIFFGLFLSDGLAALRKVSAGSERDWRIGRLLLGAAVPTPLRRPAAWFLDRLGRRYEARMTRWVPRRALAVDGYWRLEERQNDYRRRFLAALDERGLDALICPPNALPASTHGCFYTAFAGSYTMLYNLLGMPAGVVAATRVRPGEESDREVTRDPVVREARDIEEGSTGLPVGVQVVARHWREDLVLVLMKVLEEAFLATGEFPRPPEG